MMVMKMTIMITITIPMTTMMYFITLANLFNSYLSHTIIIIRNLIIHTTDIISIRCSILGERKLSEQKFCCKTGRMQAAGSRQLSVVTLGTSSFSLNISAARQAMCCGRLTQSRAERRVNWHRERCLAIGNNTSMPIKKRGSEPCLKFTTRLPQLCTF